MNQILDIFWPAQNNRFQLSQAKPNYPSPPKYYYVQSPQEVSQILYKHMHQQPLTIRDFMIKSIGKLDISWDDLLQYLQQDISIREAVKKIQLSHASAYQIIENHSNEFTKLINYVKQRQSNVIQAIKGLPRQIAGQGLFLVCFTKEMIIYDLKKGQVVGNIVFKYSNIKENILKKEEQKKILKQIQQNNKREQCLDKVVNLDIKKKDHSQKKASARDQRFVASNLKNSVRCSQISSQKSNDKMLFRKLHSDYGDIKRKQKSDIIKIKNDDTKQIFQIFQNASINNSIHVARKYSEARSNFHKHISLDKSFLQKQQKQAGFQHSSMIFHSNFKKQLYQMKQTSFNLNKVHKSFSTSTNKYMKNDVNESKRQLTVQTQDNQILKKKKNSLADALSNNNSNLQIVHFSLLQNYLLISLFNREIRLVYFKKSISKITADPIFEKSFRQVVVYLQLYKTQNSGQYRVVLALQKSAKVNNQEGIKNIKLVQLSASTNIIVYSLDNNKKIKKKLFDYDFQFSAKCKSMLPLGVVLFNQKGCFSLVQLNYSNQQIQQKIVFCLTLYNPSTNYRICISQVRYHKNLMSLYLCCTNGYIYLFDKLCKQIKYHSRINPSPVLDMCLIKDDKQIIVLYANGNMAILSAFHLQKIFVYQSYHDIFAQSKLFPFDSHHFYIYTARDILSYSIIQNHQKRFHNIKPIKILKNRNKLKNKLSIKIKREKQKILKVIQGKGGKADFLSLIYQNGQICILDHQLKYIGSYYFFNVSSVVSITCNQSFQFIFVLTQDNHVEVVNLYTQNLLFQLILNEIELYRENNDSFSKNNSKDKHIISKTNKPKAKMSIKCAHLNGSQNQDAFLAIISQQNKVYHFSQKGVIISTINLQKACGQGYLSDQMMYEQKQFVFLTKGSITVANSKSYEKKYIVNVSQHQLIKFRKAIIQNTSTFVCIDSYNKIFLVDIYLRKVKQFYAIPDCLKYETILFNQHLLFKQEQNTSKIVYLSTQKQIEIKTDFQQFYFKIIGQNIIRVNKNSGRISKFNEITREFQQIFI